MPEPRTADIPAAGAAPAAPAPPKPPTTATRAALRRWGRRLPRNLVVVPVICLGIAAILTALEGRGFGYKLLYSLCIGLACTLLVDLARVLLAWLSERMHRARGQLADPELIGRGWASVIPATLLAMLLGPVLGMQLGDWLTGHVSPSLLNLGNLSTRLTLAFSVLATIIAVLVLSTSERLASARALAEAAQRQAAENQLRLLQSQLEPHMLFNTLANLRVLIGLDPAQAQAMLDRLIAFLRNTLQASRSSTQPLADEFAQLSDYLALMAMRMGPRLQVQLELPPALAALPVPPLLLQPLVENAIKHGLEPKVQGGRIQVSARIEGAQLVLDVRDTGVGLAAAPSRSGSRFGLEQVRARLATLHGTQATLLLAPAADADGGVLASVRLPLAPALR